MKTENIHFAADYLTATIWVDSDSDMKLLQTYGLDVGLAHAGGSNRGYYERWTNGLGLNVYRFPVSLEHGQRMTLEFKGQAIRHFGWKRICALFAYLQIQRMRFQLSRLDLAFDHQFFTASDVWSEIVSGQNIETRVKEFDQQGGLNAQENFSVYIGSRKSIRYINCYQKSMEDHPTFGNQYFNRVELRLKDEQASAAFFHMLCLEDDYPKLAEYGAGLVRGVFDIKAEWWFQLFSVPAEKLRGAVRRVQDAIERTARWLHVQVLPSLAAYIEAVAIEGLEDYYLLDLVKKGKKRMKPRYKAMVAAFDENYSYRYCPVRI